MQLWQALVMGALQGVAELFPVSSLAHTILIPALLGWHINQQAGDFLAFVVALHLATALALVIYFWRDWLVVLRAYLGSIQRRQLVYDKDSKFAWLLVAGTIIVGVVGLLFEKKLSQLFDDPKLSWLVALFLVLNGGMMLYGEYLRRRTERQATIRRVRRHAVGAGVQDSVESEEAELQSDKLKKIEDLSFGKGGAVGAAQTIALLPGFSRSGVTIMAGLWAGLTHEAAARFSFMLATPVIGLAALLKVPDLLKPEAKGLLGPTILAAVLAGLTAYLSVRFLMRYFETRRLRPFAYYCMGAGVISLVILLTSH